MVAGRSKPRHIKCIRCNLDWNISKGKRVARSGYICPHCVSKEKAEREARKESKEARNAK